MPVRHESNENLVTMVAVVVIVSMIALVAKMVEQHSVPMILPIQPVKGYVRPGSSKKSSSMADALSAMEQKKSQIMVSNEDMANIKKHFERAVLLLHGEQFEYAITALDEILKLGAEMPEVYINMGFAYFGLKEYKTAISAFQRAIDLRPSLTNAYYGLAEAYEGAKDLEAALGAMRSYIHLSNPDDSFLPKARSAIWEWEAQLGRVKLNPAQLRQQQQAKEPLRPPLIRPQN